MNHFLYRILYAEIITSINVSKVLPKNTALKYFIFIC